MVLMNFNKLSVEPSLLRRNDEIRQRERMARMASVLDSPPVHHDEVQLGRALDGLQLQDVITERIVSNISDHAQLNESLSTNGVSQSYPNSVSTPVGQTNIESVSQDPTVVADRIFAFIENDIIPAFKSQNPDPSVADVESLGKNLMKGFKAGIDDAQKILNGLGSLNETSRELMAELDNIVSGKLAEAVKETLLT